MNPPPTARRFAILRLAAGIVVAAACLYYLFTQVDLGALVDTLRVADVGKLLLALLFLYLSIAALEAWRFYLALRGNGLSFAASHQMVVVSLLAANVIGSFVAADAWRLYRIGRLEGGTLSSKVSRFVAVRLVGLLAMVVTFVLWLPFVPDFFVALSRSGARMEIGTPAPWIAAAIAVGAVAALSGFLLFRARIERLYASIMEGLRELSAATWLAIGTLSFAVTLVRAISISLFIYALGGDIPLLFPIGLVTLMIFGTMIPLTPANVGVREFIFVAVLTFFHQTPELALAVALLDRAAAILISLLGLPAFLAGRKDL